MKIIDQLMLMNSKYFLFDVIKSEFIEKQIHMKKTFEEYKIYITSLKNDINDSTKCVEFY